jgi:hypothetical protein
MDQIKINQNLSQEVPHIAKKKIQMKIKKIERMMIY